MATTAYGRVVLLSRATSLDERRHVAGKNGRHQRLVRLFSLTLTTSYQTTTRPPLQHRHQQSQHHATIDGDEEAETEMDGPLSLELPDHVMDRSDPVIHCSAGRRPVGDTLDGSGGRIDSFVGLLPVYDRGIRLQNYRTGKCVYATDTGAAECRCCLDADQRFVLDATTYRCRNDVDVTTFQTAAGGEFLRVEATTGNVRFEKLSPVEDQLNLKTGSDGRYFFRKNLPDRHDRIKHFMPTVLFDRSVYLAYKETDEGDGNTSALSTVDLTGQNVGSHPEIIFLFAGPNQ